MSANNNTQNESHETPIDASENEAQQAPIDLKAPPRSGLDPELFGHIKKLTPLELAEARAKFEAGGLKSE